VAKFDQSKTLSEDINFLEKQKIGTGYMAREQNDNPHIKEILEKLSYGPSMDLMVVHHLIMICQLKKIYLKRKMILKLICYAWLPEIQNIFYQGNKRKIVPNNQDSTRLIKFYDCAAALMVDHVQSLLLNSMKDYTNMIVSPSNNLNIYQHPGFIIQLILKNGKLIFEPTFEEFKTILKNLFETMIHSLDGIPRIETKLYSEWDNSSTELKPIILDSVINHNLEAIENLIEVDSKSPIRYILKFDKYNFLIEKEIENEINMLLSENRDFFEYSREYNKYERLSNEIKYNTEKSVRLGTFEISCDLFIKALTKRAEYLSDVILNKMIHDHQKANIDLAQEYEKIAEKALTTPANTEELVQLQKYISVAKYQSIVKLEQKLANSKDRLLFLIDNSTFSPADMQNNSNVFLWNERIKSIFDEHDIIIKDKKVQFQDALKLKQDRFAEDLEVYSKQVDELKNFGDINDVDRYLKKSEILSAKFTAASEKIEQFNREEEAYDWKITQYPQLKKTKDRLAPYLQLYEQTVKFNTQYLAWMTGPMESIDPDEVEKDVMNYNRILYKLEKTFKDSPSTRKIATKVNYILVIRYNETEKYEANFYPITNSIHIHGKTDSITVLVDRPVGGTSPHKGQIDLLIHRSLASHDQLGIPEKLVDNSKIHTIHSIMFDKSINDIPLMNQNKLNEPVTQCMNGIQNFDTYENSTSYTNYSITNSNPESFKINKNVHLLTLQMLQEKILMRFQYNDGKIEKQESLFEWICPEIMFKGLKVKTMESMSLDAVTVNSDQIYSEYCVKIKPGEIKTLLITL
ncbi:hypothetical protein A3Q56_02324, partial [Intoshia linei]